MVGRHRNRVESTSRAQNHSTRGDSAPIVGTGRCRLPARIVVLEPSLKHSLGVHEFDFNLAKDILSCSKEKLPSFKVPQNYLVQEHEVTNCRIGAAMDRCSPLTNFNSVPVVWM
jgi:hypothetical protein